MNRRSDLMLTVALGLLIGLVVLATLVRLIEPRFAFFPMAGESVTPRDFGVDYDSAAVRTRDGERLRSWSLAGPAARARIVYFHGNGGNLSMWAPMMAGIARHGYSVFAFDYRGYGVSTGRPTEQGMYRDVDAVVQQFWRDSSSGTPVVYWGRSLGVAMAAYAATVRAPDGLILESGFPDARSLIRTSPVLACLALFSTYRFPSAEFLHRLDQPVPVLVMHGDNDHVISIVHGRTLFDAIEAPKRFVTVRRGDHNDLTPSDPDAYWGSVRRNAMKVKDIMTTDMQTCTPDTTVAEAAQMMWERDCGVLPVVDDGELVGVVTDRDMYIALATQNARASRLRVGAVATKKLATCAPEDDVQTALVTMKQACVRRLPVVGAHDSIVGILSINDILLAAGVGKAVGNEEVVETLQAICAHHPVSDVSSGASRVDDRDTRSA